MQNIRKSPDRTSSNSNWAGILIAAVLTEEHRGYYLHKHNLDGQGFSGISRVFMGPLSRKWLSCIPEEQGYVVQIGRFLVGALHWFGNCVNLELNQTKVKTKYNFYLISSPSGNQKLENVLFLKWNVTSTCNGPTLSRHISTFPKS